MKNINNNNNNKSGNGKPIHHYLDLGNYLQIQKENDNGFN